jgi:hypothetical protein
MKVSAFPVRIATLLLLTPLISLSQAGPGDAPRGFNLLTPEQEIKIGRQSAIVVEKRMPIISDAGVNEYINNLGQRLAARAGGAGYPYSFKIANVSKALALAFPGGMIYITRGTIEAARSEGELAGALSLAIAHVALRHGACQASKAYLARAGLAALGGLAGRDAARKIIDAIGGPGFNPVFLIYSREAESESCALAAQIMSRAGYDPREMAAFDPAMDCAVDWQADQAETPGEDSAGRSHGRPQSPPVSTSDFHRIQTHIAKLPVPHMEAPAIRSVPTAPAMMPAMMGPSNRRVESPSSNLQDYWLHGGLRIQVSYPENWMAYPSGDDLGVTLIPPGGLAETRGFSRLIYGAVFRRYRPIGDNSLWTGLQPRSFRYIGGRGELVEATNDLLDSALQNNPHLEFSRGSDRRGLIDGRQAITLTLAGRSPATGRAERAQLYIREFEDGDIAYAIFIAPGDEYDDFRPVFDRMLRGLKINDKELRRGN